MMKTATPPSNLFSPSGARVYSIDAGRPFLPDLAKGLTGAIGGDPLTLADTTILVPTRRAARTLADAFADASPQGAVLLPQIKPLGDIDEDEFTILSGAREEDLELPPVVSALERQLVLARLVTEKDKAFTGHTNWAAAISAARELAKLIDSFYTEEIDFNALKEIAPEEHAEHWGHSLKFLEIVTENWPQYLRSIDRLDPTARKIALINAQTEHWKRAKPTHPIIIAGTTGSAPSVARLAKTVMRLERGLLVLPGLDRELTQDERHWECVDDPHPQAGMKLLLKELKVDPDAVAPWPGGGGDAPRKTFLSLALRPAEATDDWRRMVEAASETDPGLANATRGLSLIEADDEEAEATAVALLMREALETDDETVMLVTPDRDLARRTALKMRRWGVAVDDSGGTPLSNSLCGTYLRLVADWLHNPAEPVALLALARSPLARFGLPRSQYTQKIAALDKTLRGLRPQPGLAGLAEKIKTHRREHETGAALSLLPILETALGPWTTIAEGHEAESFSARLSAHIHAAETLAASNDEAGEERLWRRDDGEACAARLEELTLISEPLDFAGAGDYARIFTQLMAGATLRRRRDAHPRIAILGPLEARLQSADHIILGGLNEGVWPGDAPGDPFLSRPMRSDIGLPSPERRIGLAAHDFAQAASAPRVTLTRALKAGGKPAKPSRWLVRIRNILNGAKCESVDRSAEYTAYIAALDHADPPNPVARPEPKPPVAARPRDLFVTDVEKWLRDPYAIYAKHVLNLRKLDPPGENFDPRHLGQLMHKVLEDFARNHIDLAGDAAVAQLHSIFDRHAPAYGFTDDLRPFWRASLDDTFRWFAAFNETAPGAPAVLEQKGACALAAGAGEFTLRARADRIDFAETGEAYIYDYKARALPTMKQEKKFSPQLSLTGLIVEKGGYEMPAGTKVAGFQYLRTVERQKEERKNRVGLEGDDAAAMISETGEGVTKLIALFDDEETPYLSQPRPEYQSDYGDYDHLARRREWAVEADEEGGGQ